MFAFLSSALFVLYLLMGLPWLKCQIPQGTLVSFYTTPTKMSPYGREMEGVKGKERGWKVRWERVRERERDRGGRGW